MAIEHTPDGSFTEPGAEARWKSLQKAGLSDGEVWSRMRREGFFQEEATTGPVPATSEESTSTTRTPEEDHAFRAAVAESKRIFAEGDRFHAEREAARQVELDQRVRDAIRGSSSDMPQA